MSSRGRKQHPDSAHRPGFDRWRLRVQYQDRRIAARPRRHRLVLTLAGPEPRRYPHSYDDTEHAGAELKRLDGRTRVRGREILREGRETRDHVQGEKRDHK